MMEARALVWLSMAFLLIECGVAAMYYSSRLVHRFSDEMKALRISRNGESAVANSSWPERRSLEYCSLLAKGDVQRQNMKLGQYQYLFPSQSSKTIGLGNDFGWLHYTWIDIGMPSVSFFVALDAGSDLLWVPCDCVQCAPLSASSYSNLVLLGIWGIYYAG